MMTQSITNIFQTVLRFAFGGLILFVSGFYLCKALWQVALSLLVGL